MGAESAAHRSGIEVEGWILPTKWVNTVAMCVRTVYFVCCVCVCMCVCVYVCMCMCVLCVLWEVFVILYTWHTMCVCMYIIHT